MVKATQIRWGEGWNDRPVYPVLVAKTGRPVEVVPADRALIVPTHWHVDMRRTLPCIGESAGCELCKTIRPRIKGYLAAWYGNGKPVVVEVTEGAMRAFPALRTDGCIGHWLRFERRGGRNNGSLFVVPLDRPRWETFPPPHDIKPTLVEMWGIPD